MITAIICAAGKGARTGFARNKLLEEYEGMPVMCRTLSRFSAIAEIDEILITCSKEDEEAFTALLAPYPQAKLVRGGNTRFESVLHALRKATGDIVLVHDGARPFVSESTIYGCIQSVKEFGSGVCALPVTDTVVGAENLDVTFVPKRKNVFTVQTPQGFYTKKLLAAYEKAHEEGKAFTDESGVYLEYAGTPRLFIGNRENRKLTFAEDFCTAPRVGFGVDTHAFGAERNFITLAGVQIPSKSGLIAHSDGDVLVHAVMDALLSAAGLRDIGYYFPDTDERYAGADSMLLLREVVQKISEQGFAVFNLSVSVLAETPRLAPYIEKMKENLASALSLPLSSVGIAAGTNEKLGYIGEGKGITVYAYASLKLL